ncbi:MAG: hypothetical protein ACR2G5_04175 [Pyrinomonadaceae bacterium]
MTRNAATSDYNALQTQFERRLSHGLQAMASYTWSHSIDIASTETLITTPEASLDPRVDRVPSNFDIRHSVAAAVTYDLPIPGRDRAVRAIFGGWSMDAMLRARSATPITVLVGGGRSLFSIRNVARPNLVPNVPLYIRDKTAPGGKRINPAAFAVPALGVQGTLGRNSVRGFPLSQVDFALRRQFTFAERLHLHLRAEFFNLFNHPNFAPPVPFLPQPSFGRSPRMFNQNFGFDAGLLPRYQVGGPRSIQLAMKLQF